MEGWLSPLPQAKRKAVLECARIWLIELESDESVGVAFAKQALGTEVVSRPSSEAAWSRLLVVAGYAAKLRGGYDGDSLRDELRRAEVQLRSDQPGSPGARRAALVRYKHRLQRNGETLHFTGLSATVPELELEVADADLRVAEGGPGGN